MILGYILHLGEIITLEKCCISGSEKYQAMSRG